MSDPGVGQAAAVPTRQFRKKPVVIEAMQWRGDNFADLQQWSPVTMLPAKDGNSLIIGTLEDGPNCEAVHVASLGDWIIRGVKGEFYPCKPDIFAATYEPARAANPSTTPPPQVDALIEHIALAVAQIAEMADEDIRTGLTTSVHQISADAAELLPKIGELKFALAAPPAGTPPPGERPCVHCGVRHAPGMNTLCDEGNPHRRREIDENWERAERQRKQRGEPTSSSAGIAL